MEKFSLFMIVDRLGVSNPSGWPIPVAARSKAWVCDRPLAGIADSNPAFGMDVSLANVVCCQVEVSAAGLITRPEESYRA